MALPPKKWNPGHYMQISFNESADEYQSLRFGYYDEIATNTQIQGVAVGYKWGQLESEEGVYTFDMLDNEIAYLSTLAVPKRLFLRIHDRSYGTSLPRCTTGDVVFPTYLQNGLVCSVTTGGSCPKLWETYTQERLAALHEAIAARYDSHPYFEGVYLIRETATNGQPDAGDNYDSELNEAGINALATAANAAYIQSNAVMSVNYSGGWWHVRDIFAHNAGLYIGQGGPDVLPESQVDAYDALQGVGNYTIDYRGIMPVLYSVEASEMGGVLGDFLPDELRDFANDTLKASHLFWMRNTWEGTPEQQWYGGILPMINDTANDLTNIAAPSNYDQGVITGGDWSSLLSNPQNTPEPDGATLTIDSNSDLGTLYSYSKTTPFNGTPAEKAAEIIANGVGQVPVLGTNTRVVTGQDQLTDHYAGWVQDSEASLYGDDQVMVFNMGAGETLTIPGVAATYLFDIDWGDGTIETGLITNGAGPHTYTDSIEAVVRISGVFPQLQFNNTGDIGKLIKILNWGDVASASARHAYYGAVNLVEVSSIVTNTSGVTDAYQMMRNWTSLIDPPDTSGFDTGNITTAYGMMWNWPAMTSPPDVSSFNMSKVTNVVSMMRNWTGMGAVDIDIDLWDVQAVTAFTLFLSGSQLTTACYNRVLNAWSIQTLVNTTNVDFGTSTYSDAAAHAAMVANVGRDSNGLLVIDGGLAP